ncbi:MAG: histidine phosphatase family protein [Ruminococcaceae bacterium]|nr:histidine phosphatase family protein [Oscillospiraceae bacterium]
MLLFYIRHGDPIYDPDKLTPLGEEQAKAVAKRLALFGVDEIYSSTSNRAMQTAQPTCELLGLPLKTLDFMNENYLNDLKIPLENKKVKEDWVWSHPTYSQILTSKEIREMGDEWYRHPAFEPFHFDKVLHPIHRQADEFIASHGYEHDPEKGLYKVINYNYEKRVALFAHECIGKIFMSHLLDLPFPQYATHFEMHTSAMTVIRFDDGTNSTNSDKPNEYARARVLTLSNDSHLYHEGISMSHRFTHIREEY